MSSFSLDVRTCKKYFIACMQLITTSPTPTIMMSCTSVDHFHMASDDDDSKNRISAVHEAFRQCNHREQVQLLDELAKYCKRDFLTLLPLEMAEKILSYIPLSCVLGACIRVSGLSIGLIPVFH